jgi:hypothetical protein
MRKWIGLLLIAALAVSPELPAFAAEQDTQAVTSVTVSMSTIEKIMCDYNQDIQTIENDLRNTKEQYNNEKGNPNSDSSAANAYKIAQTKYEQQVQQKVLSAKQQYISFCVDNVQLQADQVSADNDKKTFSLKSGQLSGGYISQKDYNDALNQASKSKNALDAQQSKLTREKWELKTLLNIPDGVNFTIQPVTAADMDITGIPSIGYNADVILMVTRNADIIAAEQNYDFTKDDLSNSSSTIDNAYISWQQTISSRKATFQQLYDSMMSSYQTWLLDSQTVQRKTNDLAVEKQKLTQGFSSQTKVDQANLDLLLSEATAALDQSNAYSTLMSYNNMKNGYTASGSAQQ